MTGKLSKKQINIQNIIFVAVMAAAAVFLFWKCRYGFANKDESLYLAIPYRFWQGDSMFVHEWNLSQFSSFLMLPLVHIYMLVAGTTEGMLLTFRYVFTAVQALTAVFIYTKLKKYSWLAALTASLVFFLYAPFGIMALSYNSIGIQCITVATLLLMTNSNRKKLPYIAAGVLFAAAVLCCPFLVAVYAFYTLLMLINVIKKGCFSLDVLQKKSWLWITVGISALAAAFLLFAVSRASVPDIIVALQWMLNDPQHQSSGFAYVLVSYIKGILQCNDLSLFIYAGFAVLAAAYRFIPAKKLPAALFYCAGAVLTGLMMLPFVTWELYINRVIFPLNVFALFCMLLTDSGIAKRIFKIVWIPGMLYGACIHMASTEGFLNIASTSMVSLMASIVIIVITGVEMLEKTNIRWLNLLTGCAVAAVLIMQIGCVWYTRYVSVFWESGSFGGGMHTQTQMLAQGPEKGILASKEKEELYNRFADDITQLTSQNNPENVLYLTQNTWTYLISEDVEMATFSPWLPGVTEEEFAHTMERLKEYYAINPGKMPQMIYAEDVYHSFAEKFAAEYGYTEAKTPQGNYVYTK